MRRRCVACEVARGPRCTARVQRCRGAACRGAWSLRLSQSLCARRRPAVSLAVFSRQLNIYTVWTMEVPNRPRPTRGAKRRDNHTTQRDADGATVLALPNGNTPWTNSNIHKHARGGTGRVWACACASHLRTSCGMHQPPLSTHTPARLLRMGIATPPHQGQHETLMRVDIPSIRLPERSAARQS